MNSSFLDILFIVIIIVSVLKGFIGGFIRSFFSIAAFLGATWAGLAFYKKLLTFISFPASEHIRIALAFFILFIVVFIGIQLSRTIVLLLFKNAILKSLDHALGLFFGIAEAVVIIMIIMLLLHVQPFFDGDALLEKSRIVRLLLLYLPALPDRVSDIISI